MILALSLVLFLTYGEICDEKKDNNQVKSLRRILGELPPSYKSSFIDAMVEMGAQWA